MPDDNSDPRSEQLNQVIAEFLEAIALGKAPDRDRLIKQHPELADDLKSFLANHDRMKAARERIEVPTLPPKQSTLEAATIHDFTDF